MDACFINESCKKTYENSLKCIEKSAKHLRDIQKVAVSCMKDNYLFKSNTETHNSNVQWKSNWDNLEECIEYSLKTLIFKS